MGHDVVGDQEVGHSPFAASWPASSRPKNSNDRLDTLLARHSGYVGGGLDAERRDASLHHVLQ